MQRRDFLKLASAAGLMVSSPFGLARRARAEPYEGLFFVMVNAGGGWDPTSLCDPKGTLPEEVDVPDARPMNRSYLASDILTAGNIRYAPVREGRDGPLRFAPFFDKYASKLLVINGIDTSTNGHDSGARHTWSGKLAEGFPALAALIAADKAREKPLAFMTNGGFDLTQGLVAPTRSGGLDPMLRAAFPNRNDPGNPNSTLLQPDAFAAVQAAQRDRLSRLQSGRRTLPRVRQALGSMYAARLGEAETARLADFLPNLDNSGNPLRRQAQLALAAYKAGLSAAVNLDLGGFDTHGNHDDTHIPRLQLLLDGVDFVMVEAERLGVLDKVVVVVGSEFGRTPGYNDGNGKDHWSITSMMLMGPGIRGNRVIGATTHTHQALQVNPSTLEVDEGGVTLAPGHVHRSLRRLAGISSALDQQFPLREEELPLFG